MGKKEQAVTPKPIVRVFQGENTSKAFAIEDGTTFKDLHRSMVQKLELSESEGKFWEITERWGDEGETKIDPNEKVSNILAKWEKEKKKKKKEPSFWWTENEEKQKQGKRSIRVFFRDNSFKAVTVDGETTALQLHKLVVEKIELDSDANFGLFDKRKDNERPLPPIENIVAVMLDWKKNAKGKKENEDENKFVFRLKTDFKEETIVDDPVRAHCLYLEARHAYLHEISNPNVDDCVKLAGLEVQINFGDFNSSTHTTGFLLNKLSELLPKKAVGMKKPNEWESLIFAQHKQHIGMAPLAAKLEFISIINANFRASASIVAINKAEQAREALAAKAPKKKVVVKTEAPAPPPTGASSSGGPPPPPPPPAFEEKKIRAPGEFPTRKKLKSTKASVSIRFQLLSAIEEGTKLKHTETVDRSGPKIEGVKIKKVDRDGFLKEIEGGKGLKHAETVDKSGPQIKDVKVKKSNKPEMLQDIEKGIQLKKTETVDKSGPKISKKKADASGLFEEIQKGADLIHISHTMDKSGPKIDKGVKIKKIDREGMLKGIEEGIQLKHADTVDKSAPLIETVKVKKNDRESLLKAIEGGVQLKKAE